MATHAGFFDAYVYGECGTELRRFRVPVTEQTSVRQFAQDTLARFVKQTRFNAMTEVAVEDVRASGISLFYNDPVCAVVGPSEQLEIRLQGVKASDIAMRRIAVGAGVASTAVSPEMLAAQQQQQLQQQVVQPAQAAPAPIVAAPAASVKRTRDTPAVAPQAQQTTTTTTVEQPARAQPSAEPAGRKTAKAKMVTAATEEVTAEPEALGEARKNELAWGKEAHKNFAANYVSDPEALMRALRKKKREEAAAAKAAAKAAEAADGDVTFVKEVSSAAAAREKSTIGKAATAASSSTAAAAKPAANAAVTKQPAAVPVPVVAAPSIAAGGVGFVAGEQDYRPVGVARVLNFAGEDEQ
uniref:Uncharacterized protein n=1 Tax=Neobodo designis TaxID=312471 RepID=A0A7S1PTI4_NEODS|mmetsp:Transcript_19123/g.59377  ORF Transcript_19123/g.59377 Transcript_19123/m.59377 type:complete len:355 (+) Transcript_19123:245-1309(+)